MIIKKTLSKKSSNNKNILTALVKLYLKLDSIQLLMELKVLVRQRKLNSEKIQLDNHRQLMEVKLVYQGLNQWSAEEIIVKVREINVMINIYQSRKIKVLAKRKQKKEEDPIITNLHYNKELM